MKVDHAKKGVSLAPARTEDGASMHIPGTAIAFEPPPGWTGMLVAFAAPGPAPAPYLAIAREPMRPDDTLRTHATRKIVNLTRQARGFDLLENHPIEIHGRAAVFFRAALVRNGQRFEEMTILLEPVSEADRAVTIFSVTARADRALGARQALDALVRTVRLDASRAFRASAPASTRPESATALREPAWMVPIPRPRNR